jgi:phosphatidylserine/phosphatidylglycerophosphate/cardiolipin synthase-like enzyme
MRFKSESTDGFTVFAVSGVNTISFGIDATAQARRGLLGFEVRRTDLHEREDYTMPGFKVFPSVVPRPTPDLTVSTHDHPVQSFVWDDFTAKPDREYEYRFQPLRGTPKALDRSARPVTITVHTEPLIKPGNGNHDVFFNRGVASSQAYRRKFGTRPPDELPSEQAAAAHRWLARDLEDAIIRFIDETRTGETLHGCFYEFRYLPVAEALKRAVDRGVEVQIIVDAKVNESTDNRGVFHESFPREDNLRTIRKAKLPARSIIRREARASVIQHNKFMVRLTGNPPVPVEVWTGSTNISLGGITGQTNVGHLVRDRVVAEQYDAYWRLLAADPGGASDDDLATARRKNAELHRAVAALREVPTAHGDIPRGCGAVFSPRAKLDVLEMYAAMSDEGQSCACVTLAFGVNKLFKNLLQDNTTASPVVFLLLEKKDVENPRAKDPFVALTAKNNVYEAWGSYIQDPVYQWARETNTRSLGLNTHVAYIHSKFLLMDPLSDDPIVVTGSANFSEASTKDNDENMLLIRGNTRVADIYFTEFNRLFNHYYFRSVQESLAEHTEDPQDATTRGASLFLAETDEWTRKYEPGTLRAKRLTLYTTMQGAKA